MNVIGLGLAALLILVIVGIWAAATKGGRWAGPLIAGLVLLPVLFLVVPFAAHRPAARIEQETHRREAATEADLRALRVRETIDVDSGSRQVEAPGVVRTRVVSSSSGEATSGDEELKPSVAGEVVELPPGSYVSERTSVPVVHVYDRVPKLLLLVIGGGVLALLAVVWKHAASSRKTVVAVTVVAAVALLYLIRLSSTGERTFLAPPPSPSASSGSARVNGSVPASVGLTDALVWTAGEPTIVSDIDRWDKASELFAFEPEGGSRGERPEWVTEALRLRYTLEREADAVIVRFPPVSDDRRSWIVGFSETHHRSRTHSYRDAMNSAEHKLAALTVLELKRRRPQRDCTGVEAVAREVVRNSYRRHERRAHYESVQDGAGMLYRAAAGIRFELPQVTNFTDRLERELTGRRQGARLALIGGLIVALIGFIGFLIVVFIRAGNEGAWATTQRAVAGGVLALLVLGSIYATLSSLTA